ncbi:hypothetical protein ANCCAN_09235 [Ancylostoma caninum]|uniref:NR LBD domain-containing protein n=1 Tax=Ancylostoma caninum TaxID=29170 RepID=A0A368GP81_ANCCA|nr:hypothetical protein ANCCAN_09235 [Ancylostoma caninum]
MISFWTFQQDYEGIILGCGLRIEPKGNQENELMSVLTTLATRAHTHIISIFRKMNITRGEYLFLKAIALFEDTYTAKWN